MIPRTIAALVLLCGPALAEPPNTVPCRSLSDNSCPLITGVVRLTDEARAIDGDTIEIAGQRIRLAGIDAPERAQTCAARDGQTYECGRDATAVLAELVRGRTVTCVQTATDHYSRIVATCSTEAGDLGAAMVRRGQAVDYTRYSKGAYRAEEAAARAEGLGIWSGRFTIPESFRRARR